MKTEDQYIIQRYDVFTDEGYLGSLSSPERVVALLRDKDKAQESWMLAPVHITRNVTFMEDYKYESGISCIQRFLSEAGASPDTQESCGGTGQSGEGA